MFLTRSTLAVVETPATIFVCQDQFWSKAFAGMIGHKKALPIVYLFQKFVYVMSTKKKKLK